MNKTITLLLAALLLSFSSFAQKDSKAKDWLDKSYAVIEKTGGMTASFTLNIKDAANKVTESFDGTISMKGNKFCFFTPEADTWFDGKTQWVYMKNTDEVNITEPDPQDVQALNPVTIFGIYKKGCNYKYLGEKTDTKMRKVHEIEILPQSKKSDMTRIVLQINAADNMPVFFHIYYKNKIENLIYINKYQTKVNLPDNTFVYDAKKHPGVDVIDLR